MNIKTILNEIFASAMTAAGAQADSNPAVRQSAKPQFGDYQVNGIMGVAKQLGCNPREFAQKVLDQLHPNEMIDKTEIAGLFLRDICTFVFFNGSSAYNEFTNVHFDGNFC